MLTVHNVMTANPVRVTPDTTLAEAAKAMAEADVGFLPVVEGTRGSPSTTALGVLTDRDLVVRGMATGLDPATTTVEEVYTHETVYAYENDLARDALDVMRRRNVGRLLVADRGDALVGVVSFARIAGFTGDVAFDGPVDLRNAESAPKVDADTAGPSR